MAGSNGNGGDRRGRRRWSFGNSAFDEASWTLTVNGRPVSIEAKPLELLRELLLRAGDLVSKEELLDKIWPDVTVVEASLPTAIHKLRLALGDDRRDAQIIQTVPRIGYRLAVPVEVQELPDYSNTPSAVAPKMQTTGIVRRPLSVLHYSLAIVVLALAVVGILYDRSRLGPLTPTTARSVYPVHETISALHRLDIAKIDSMIAAGWRPDAPIDSDRNNALNRLLEMCEWNPKHDRVKMLYVARALLDGGVTLHERNVWGDTPYSIAKAERYCGPNHPVTVMLHNMCYAKGEESGDRCLATYELKPKP